jgi:K+-transporting ATPase ATPase B chain
MNAKAKSFSLLDTQILRRTVVDAFVKLNPLHLVKNPVMFVVEIGCILTTLLLVQALSGHGEERTSFIMAISLWLWFTLLFANFAEAVAEGRGKAQARSLKGARRDVMAKLLQDPDRNATAGVVPGSQLKKGDFVLVEAGETIPGDGEVTVGVASVDESAITGESARNRRHPCAVGLAYRPHHGKSGRDVPRQDDLHGGRGQAPEDAERDRS